MHLGIDYGAKLAGTTAICFEKKGKLKVVQSEKKKDADKFIRQQINDLQPNAIFIDAPLSLPLAYFDEAGESYFYRVCDKVLQGMSPMFLGGLTARAIQLSKTAENQSINFYETYPAQIVKHYLTETENYKKQKEYLFPFCEILTTKLPFPLVEIPSNWHQVDSILAWWAGWRFKNGVIKIYGDKKEGLIYV